MAYIETIYNSEKFIWDVWDCPDYAYLDSLPCIYAIAQSIGGCKLLIKEVGSTSNLLADFENRSDIYPQLILTLEEYGDSERQAKYLQGLVGMVVKFGK